MSNQLITTDKEELVELGHEVKALLPGGEKLTDNQAVALGKYSLLTGANPFRGEAYGFADKDGNLKLVDGYKLLVRWAKKTCDYTEKYEKLPAGIEGLTDRDIGYRCTILRDDRKADLKFYIDAGASFQEAYGLASVDAVGIVTANETRNAPPKGWSWDQVARKRSLKNVLNLAYAMPSMAELAADSWQANGTETIQDDWQGVEVYKTEEERERHAELAAQNRDRQERVVAMSDDERVSYGKEIKTATDIMRNNGDEDPLDLSPEEPEIEDGEVTDGEVIRSDVTLADFPDASTGFWTCQREWGIDKQAALDILRECEGDFGQGFDRLQLVESLPV